jgi:Putative restriction endonuclease
MSSRSARYGDHDGATDPGTQPEVAEMSALLDLMATGSPLGITPEEYEAMDEELCRRIEIVDGRVAFVADPAYEHQIIGWNLRGALREKLPDGYAVANELDVRLREVPLLVRKPDVVVFRKGGRNGTSPLRAENVVLAAEIVSPGSVTVDRVDKPAEYAAAGIPHSWRLEQGFGLTLFVYELAANAATYAQPVSFDLKYVARAPFEIDLDVQALSVE